ncbi:ATP-dependent helicase [Actinomyces israelii]|uniref:DNA 3'-5' helicase n=1 Tax=Actinomyces israelii TaxID=1659 RepID=A0ABT4I9U4_9ACTO|nr:ATP-dependent DNA helicase UvrD2 [Actinomyces israelii]MCZ0858518.1 ATP-dependent DNA helicase UvrD2 [Actinomyces israelii]
MSEHAPRPAASTRPDSRPPGALPGPAALLDALDPDQRQVAEHLEGALCVLAGAGTGKTRAITYRIAHGVAVGAYQPTQVLAVTFTARAAGEMRSRLADLGVNGTQARTFHSAALRQLTYFWPTAIGGRRPEIEKFKGRLVGTAAHRLGLSADRALIRDLSAEVEWAKVTMTLPEDYAQRAAALRREPPGGLEPATVAQVLAAYEEAKTERGVIDFEDVLLLMVGILLDREDIADQVRGQYKHFVVDEYQDVSPLQQRLLDLWLGRRRQLCVVGDVSQTIYSFTGATPDFLTGFTARYAGARTVRLSRDYRSTPQVVSLANRVLSRSRRGGGAPALPAGAVELVAQRPSGPAVRFEAYDDDVAEAAGVVEHVGRLRSSGVPLSEIAVLYRTNSQSEVIEQALSGAGIGYLVRGGERFFERDEVKRAMVILRAAARTERADLTGDVGADTRMVLGREGWSERPPAPRGAVRERWDSLNAIVELADELGSRRGADLDGLVAELGERAAAQNAPTVEGVTLSSLHAAKGLEWDAVVLVGASEGLLPISLAEGPAAVEEERRLLYVGVTRAREHLVISYARARNAGGRASRKPSRFLDGIWPTGGGPAPQRGRSASSRSSRSSQSPKERARRAAAEFEADNDPATIALFEALRAWRAGVAKERSRPAYTVFADTTLRSIAVVKPGTLPQLSLIHGVGAVKLQEYGADVLYVVRDFQGGAAEPGRPGRGGPAGRG